MKKVKIIIGILCFFSTIILLLKIISSNITKSIEENYEELSLKS